jgi:hypothetical protein
MLSHLVRHILILLIGVVTVFYAPNSLRQKLFGRSSEVATLLKKLHVRPLSREGEPTVLRQAEEV